MACDHPDMLHTVASFFGVFIGGVTFTGSLAAFRKLANIYGKDKCNLPFASMLNRPICLLNAGALAMMIKSPSLGTLMLS